MEAPPGRRGGFLLRRARLKEKGCVVDLDHRTAEELAKTVVLTEKPAGYARENGWQELARPLGAVGAEVESRGVPPASPSGEHPSSGWESARERVLYKEQSVSEMAEAALARQAKARAGRTGEPFDEAFETVSQTEAGRQLVQLRDGPHRDEGAERWQEDLPPKRAKERKRARQEEQNRAREDAAWTLFVQTELRELELRKDGQLAKLLGEPLPGESATVLQWLASEDRRQAEEGSVALMSGGKIFYKHVDELSRVDCPARIAANRARTAWLKERRDGWLARGNGY